MTPAGHAEAERFRSWTARRFGLQFGDDKLAYLATLIAERAAKRGIGAGDYLETLGEVPIPEERRLLIAALTVPETYFFRHLDQIKAFCDVALPPALAAAAGTRPVRILCAGCASGEEPYSLAIWARECGIEGARDLQIRAVDLNSAVLQKAVAARYSPWALRDTPALLRERWFTREGRDYVLAASIRDSVQFEELNLAEANSAWWASNTFDVVFCRNVLMYFTREAAAQAIARLAGVLSPGGYLFLGHAETLRELSDEFELCHSHGAFYYRRSAAAQTVAPRQDALQPRPVAIARNDTRAPVADPGLPPPRVPPAQIHASAPRRTPELTERVQNAWRLLMRERFADAVDALESIPEDLQDAELQVMRAVLLTHAGRLAQAENACTALLGSNANNAEAHYLLALCRDGAHDRCGAIDHDRQAMSLAPRFALPPLHLGLMARRAGDPEDAAHHFDMAAELLQTEDAERLLLFGGGFSRAALLSLCGDRSSRRQKAPR